MELRINVEKKHFYSIVSLMLIFIGMVAVDAFNSGGPASYVGHSAGELDLSGGVNGPAVFNDAVTINDVLVVGGEIRIASSGLLCDSTKAGYLRYDGFDFFGCDGTSWNSLTNGGASPSPNDLVNGLHSSSDCTNAGGVVHDTGAGLLCRFPGSSCSTYGFGKYAGWSTTSAKTCVPTQFCYSSQCVTGSHGFSDNGTIETCSYRNSAHNGEFCEVYGPVYTCSATVVEVGCF